MLNPSFFQIPHPNPPKERKKNLKIKNQAGDFPAATFDTPGSPGWTHRRLHLAQTSVRLSPTQLPLLLQSFLDERRVVVMVVVVVVVVVVIYPIVHLPSNANNTMKIAMPPNS